ncbi:TauD/TfdA family dioxygenase [Chitinimonas viridis]|uniref:TauD/TfdA family dioxygenase n=1 Tax=Chitinimonas viridis TaxID=664880 RepID=A0ABT8B8G5_9NEIS|nr:TauD/TfdA family dioxygenase [Chitinimonas viridis]MDN3578329.1 TauD/TfdA family dioxygenase [Chitinimonas viridis]
MKTTPYCTPERLLEITYPVVLEGQKLGDWISHHRTAINTRLEREGVVLMRGLNVISSGQFATIASGLFGGELLSYSNRSTPRTELRGNVYTSTEYPKEESIPQHNENAYSHEWPMKIAFLCLVAAEQGGATPVADSRVVYQRMPADIREKFVRKGVKYVRNYSSVGLPWQEVFQADTREEVNAYCERNGIRYEWLDDDQLRTEQVCPGVAVHPHTGDKVWFNQAHLFHVSNHTEENRQALLQTFGEARLPRHAYYGDGEPLEEDVLEAIRTVYEEEKLSFAWQGGDLMLLDNMLYSHGRDPYDGARKVLVAMADARTWND